MIEPAGPAGLLCVGCGWPVVWPAGGVADQVLGLGAWCGWAVMWLGGGVAGRVVWLGGITA
jgi:hypothetical protein